MDFNFVEEEQETVYSSVWTAVGVVAGVGLVALACD